MAERLILLDGMALIYRAHFALMSRPMINSRGLNTSAVFGYTHTVLQLLDQYQPTHMALALDTSEPTERHEIYPEYKAKREEVPEDILKSIPYVEKMSEALGITVLKYPGFEADDVIGTLAVLAGGDNPNVLMVTPDKDFAQLVSDHAVLLKPARRGTDLETLGVAEIREKWNVKSPSSVADVLGLWGDASDNIPGVPGIGEKTAKKLMGEYDTVENLIEHAEDLKGALKNKVESHVEQALLSKRLATINTAVPIQESIADLKLSERDLDGLSVLCEELEFNSLAKRLLGADYRSPEPGERPGGGEMPAPYSSFDAAKQSYSLLSSLDQLTAILPRLQAAHRICVDTETDGLDCLDCRLLGVALSIAANEAWYCIPPEHAGERETWIAELTALFSSPDRLIIGHNLKFDLQVLQRHGIGVEGPYHDTMIAHALVDPDQRHKMDDLARQLLQYDPIPFSAVAGEGKADQVSMFDPPLEKMTTYAAEDADITFQLATVLEKKLADSGQMDVFQRIEMPLVETLTRMEYEGIGLDLKALSGMADELGAHIVEIEDKVYELAGHSFNLNSPKQLGEVLFSELKIVDKPKKTRTGQFSTNEQVLTGLAGTHEIIDHILDYREASKLKSTYVDALPQAIHPRTKRVHTSFSQTITATGRLASSDPNLQNIPIRTAMGKRIREAFVPHNPSDLLLAADYSQIELRIMADLSEDEGLCEAFRDGLDIHQATAAKVYGVELDAVDREMRRKAKMVNFGIIYGISAFGLSQRLRIPRGEAAEIIDAYFEQYPKVRAYMKSTIEQAHQQGWVATKSGRRRIIRDIHSQNRTTRNGAERMAINTPVQGSAADMIKIAMNRIHQVLRERPLRSRMLLQVHDELVFNIVDGERDEVQEMVVREMENAMPLRVPVVVECGHGPNWLAAH